MILVTGTGVALIATLTVNYSLRNKQLTKTVVYDKSEFSTFYIQDSLKYYVYGSDSLPNIDIIKNFDFTDGKLDKFKLNKKDKHQIPVKFIIYIDKSNYNKLKLGFVSDDSRYTSYLNDVYIENSLNDSVAYYCKKELDYVIDNRWTFDLSMPSISTIDIIYLPPSLYAAIPDSLIHKAPY
jgi:hypothetical protein